MNIDAVARYKIPDMIPDGGRISFDEIGQKTGLKKNAVRRILRNAMSMHILQEPDPGMVAHTSVSKFLANPAINGWAQFEGRDTWPATTRVCAQNSSSPDSHIQRELADPSTVDCRCDPEVAKLPATGPNGLGSRQQQNHPGGPRFGTRASDALCK